MKTIVINELYFEELQHDAKTLNNIQFDLIETYLEYENSINEITLKLKDINLNSANVPSLLIRLNTYKSLNLFILNLLEYFEITEENIMDIAQNLGVTKQ